MGGGQGVVAASSIYNVAAAGAQTSFVSTFAQSKFVAAAQANFLGTTCTQANVFGPEFNEEAILGLLLERYPPGRRHSQSSIFIACCYGSRRHSKAELCQSRISIACGH